MFPPPFTPPFTGPFSAPGAQNEPDLGKLSQDLYQQWEAAMTSWWDQVLESPDVLKASGAGLGSMAQARRRYEEGVDQALERMHLPTRTDLVRVARIATLLEERLLKMEDRLLELQDQLARTEREALQARVEAAEARLELHEKLQALAEARAAAAVEAPAPATLPPAPTRRPSRKEG